MPPTAPRRGASYEGVPSHGTTPLERPAARVVVVGPPQSAKRRLIAAAATAAAAPHGPSTAAGGGGRRSAPQPRGLFAEAHWAALPDGDRGAGSEGAAGFVEFIVVDREALLPALIPHVKSGEKGGTPLAVWIVVDGRRADTAAATVAAWTAAMNDAAGLYAIGGRDEAARRRRAEMEGVTEAAALRPKVAAGGSRSADGEEPPAPPDRVVSIVPAAVVVTSGDVISETYRDADEAAVMLHLRRLAWDAGAAFACVNTMQTPTQPALIALLRHTVKDLAGCWIGEGGGIDASVVDAVGPLFVPRGVETASMLKGCGLGQHVARRSISHQSSTAASYRPVTPVGGNVTSYETFIGQMEVSLRDTEATAAGDGLLWDDA